MLEFYMAKWGIQPNATNSKKLFQLIIRGYEDRLEDRGITCSRMSELVKDKLKELQHPIVEFGPHSLRIGGTTAAAVAGVPFKKHGMLENAKDGYIEDLLEQQILVVKKLGL